MNQMVTITLHSILVILILSVLSVCDGDPDAHDIDDDEETNFKRRIQFRKISLDSNTPAREIRSRGSASGRPPNLNRHVSPPLCKYCPPVTCGRRMEISRLENRQGRILDGVEADYGAYPWQVSIEKRGETTGERWTHICGGALISKFHVLTAAHCFRDTISDYRVIVGNHFLNKTDVSEQVFEVHPGDYTNHRRFGYESEYDNDIAFVRLRGSGEDRGVEFDQYVHPICLPPEQGIELKPGVRCHVSGWGVQDKRSTQKVSSILRVAEVPVQSKRECQHAYRVELDDDDLRENYLRRLSSARKASLITDGNLCAGGDGPDACSGDSGGPLACTLPGEPNQVFLAGLVSWGKACGSKTHPGVYTKVSHYLKWIRNEIELSRPDYERKHYK